MIEVVDYSADWCGPCRAQEPIIKKVKKELEGKAEVRKVDIDENKEEAVKAGVRSIPTILVYVDGEEVERFIGLTSKKKIVDEVKKHL